MVSKKRIYSLVFVTLNLGSFVEYGKWWNSDIPDGRHYVLVSAEWCEPCKQFKRELKTEALAKDINIIVLDVDRYPDIAKKMNPQGMIPALLEYTKKGDEWTVRKYEVKELKKFFKGE